MLVVLALKAVAPDTVAAETRALVVQTHRLVTATFGLAVVAALAIMAPLVVQWLQNIKETREARLRARDVIETIALVFEAQLRAVAGDLARASVTAGTEALVARTLDPDIARYLPRGTFELTILAISQAYGVLEQARSELPAERRRYDDSGRRTEGSRLLVTAIREQAAICTAMLRVLRQRLRTNDQSPFVDWETEQKRLRDNE